MPKLILVLLLIIVLTLSFAGIGLFMLFATGTIDSLEDVHTLLSGETPASERAPSEAGNITRQQDAVHLFQQQKQELQRELTKLNLEKESLAQLKELLLEEIDARQAQNDAAGSERASLRAQRLDKIAAIFGGMEAAGAAALMDRLSDGLVLEILPKLGNDHAADILNALADGQRKATLISQYLGGITQ
jgi:flagellar motility protein MotE (MotC chaperone)